MRVLCCFPEGISTRDQPLRSCQLVPKGLVVEQTTREDGFVRIWVRAASPTGICPSCGTISRRVHSLYLRRPSDLPLGGHRVSFHLTVRRFRCDAILCGRQVFAERFAEDVWLPRAAHWSDGAHHPPSGAGAWRASRRQLCAASDAAGQQRYISAGCPAQGSGCGVSCFRSSASTTSLAAQPSLRHDRC